MRTVPLRNLGACIAPDNSWMFLQGIETLPLRMERHCENALAVATWLQKQPGRRAGCGSPAWPTTRSRPKPEVPPRQGRLDGRLRHQGRQGGRPEVHRPPQAVLAPGQRRRRQILAIHRATTTHSQLSDEAQHAGGITPDLVRLSIGLEHIDDILADLDQALKIAAA